MALAFAGLQALVTQATQDLRAPGRDEVNALECADRVFRLGERRLPFRVEDFPLPFSVPNFCLHTPTAYDLLRLRGRPLGQRDERGHLRSKA